MKLLSLLCMAALLIAAPAAAQLAPAPLATANVATPRASPVPELAVYALISLAAPATTAAAGLGFDPEWSPFTGSVVDHPIASLGFLRLHDKLSHGIAGAELVALSFMFDSRTGREPCLLSAARGALRAVAVGALYEGVVAFQERSRGGEPGYGFGWGDQGALALGAIASGGITCAVRALTR